MPSKQRDEPLLSLILCSRNDSYMGNSRWRLDTALNYTAERVRDLDRVADVEILVADWGSETPLRDVVALGPAARDIVSFVTVPPSLARELQRDSPFPEVLALNAAARRTRGRYIGRIDQDTLVGERFLRWFFDALERDTPRDVLFSNRRDIPYRLAVRAPHLRQVTTFIRQYGDRLPIWRENSATRHVFWTSNVGIFLAHRDLWYECGAYDERLIYYNWMETDMICRLRQTHPVVDLGALTGCDFYHLDHRSAVTAWVAPPRAIKNAVVDLSSPPGALHPNSDAWGLAEYDLPRERGAGTVPAETGGIFAILMLHVAMGMAIDRFVIVSMAYQQLWRGRFTRTRDKLGREPLSRWPGLLWRVWRGRRRATIRT